MKKIITFGDLHGQNVWRKTADIDYLMNVGFEDLDNHIDTDYDYYVFVGDYVDSFTKTNDEIYENLLNVIKFKKMYPKKVILIWGNHDMQYLTSFEEHGCSGFRPEAYFDLHEVFRKNKDLFQLAFQIDNYLWTHAGIHRGWYEYEFPYKSNNVAEDLNTAFLENVKCLFDVGLLRGGFKNVGGPLWADRRKTMNKPLKDFHQIVGHTRVKEIKTHNIDNKTSITFIDTMESNNPKPYVLKIKTG